MRVMHVIKKPLTLMDHKSLLILSAVINGTKYAVDNICHIMGEKEQTDVNHNQMTLIYNTPKCIYYMKGNCKYGTNCRFRHDYN